MAEDTLIALTGALDISRMSELQFQLAAGLEQHLPITLETEQVERVDAAALQVLCAFVRAAEVAGLACRWQSVSPALLDAARLTGLESCLNLPQAA